MALGKEGRRWRTNRVARVRRRTDRVARARRRDALRIWEEEGTGVKPILVVEIVSALMGLACLVALCAGGVHGVAASAYASGAHPLAYACGWASLAAFAACGASALPPVRAKAPGAVRWHVPLFVVGVALFVAHAVLGRM